MQKFVINGCVLYRVITRWVNFIEYFLVFKDYIYINEQYISIASSLRVFHIIVPLNYRVFYFLRCR